MESLQITLVLGAWQKGYYRSALGVDVDDARIVWIELNRPSITRYRWCLWNLPTLAKSLNVQVVHLLHQLPVIKALFSCPVVLTMHDLYAYDDPEVIGYPNVYLNRLVIRSSLAASTEVVSISQTTKDRLIHWFPRLKKKMQLPVIYQSVSISQPQAPSEPVPGPFFLCVAQHRSNKNLDYVMKGHHLAVERGVCPPDTKLVIVGSEGPETPRLQELAQTIPGVMFLNTISDAHLAYLYKTCELYIGASSTEGFCLPLVEAMLSSCQAICSDIPIFQEVGGEAVTYFSLQNRDLEILVEAIGTALKTERVLSTSPALMKRVGDRWVEVFHRVAQQANHT